jgi:hypothetical protein
MPKTLQKPEILTGDNYSETIFHTAFSKSGLKIGKHGWRPIKNWDNISSRSAAPLLVAWTVAGIERNKVKDLRRLKRNTMFLLFQRDLPSQAVVDRMAWLDIRDDKRIYCIDTNKEGEAFVERLLLALDSKDYENRIIDAWWEDDTLVIVSLREDGFNKLRVPLQKLPALQNHKKEDLENYEIDEDGIFIYWPNMDVHLGWEQFEQIIDQGAYLKAKQQSEIFNKAYGAAIRNLREKYGLHQSDIKGLTPRQVGRIERGECRATHNALTKFAKAHNMSVSNYMNELANLL